MPLVRDQRAAVLGLLNDRPVQDWARPTPCPLWTVHDVAAHLVENELLLGRLYRGELTAPSAEDLDQQAGVDRWARADGETIRFSLWHHGSATQRVIDSRTEESWRRVLRLRNREVQLRHLLRQHFFELAVHAHDIATALGAAAPWGDRVGPIVEFCLRSAPGSLSRRTPPVEHIGVRVPDVGSWTLEASDGWRLVPGEPAASPIWIVEAEVLILATTGRLDAAEALERSKMEGDASRVAAVLSGWRATE